jgi:hypothetical protein
LSRFFSSDLTLAIQISFGVNHLNLKQPYKRRAPVRVKASIHIWLITPAIISFLIPAFYGDILSSGGLMAWVDLGLELQHYAQALSANAMASFCFLTERTFYDVLSKLQALNPAFTCNDCVFKKPANYWRNL